MKKLLGAAGALILALGLTVGVGIGAAQAHNLGLDGTAVCQSDGTYTITWTGTTTNVPDGDTGVATIKSHTPPSSTLSSNTVPGIVGNTTFTFTQSGIPGNTNQANVNLDIAWTGVDTYKQNDVTGHKKLDGDCKPPVVGRDVPIIPAVFHPATCTVGSTFDTFAQDPDVKYTVDSPPVGVGQALAPGVSVTITAHVKAEDLVANGGTDNPGSYTVTFTGQPLIHNASCADAVVCHALGTPYHESDDNEGVLFADGWHLFVPDPKNGKATDVIFPAEGNLQGLTSFTWNSTGFTGNGIFIRFIVDLTADGGGGYNSLSITDGTVTQASIANVGSKALFLGKTIAQIADLYPHAVYHAISFQTGSAYDAGNGAVLTGFSGGDCAANFVAPPLPETKVTYTDWEDGDYACGDTTVTQTRTKETTTYSYTADFQVTSTVTDEQQTQTRDLTADEILALNCPTQTPTPTPTPTSDLPTPPLATTGVDASMPFGIGIAALGSGVIIALLVTLYRRRQHN